MIPTLIFIAVLIAFVLAYSVYLTSIAPRLVKNHKVLESRSDIRLSLGIAYDSGPLASEKWTMRDLEGVSTIDYRALGRNGIQVSIVEQPSKDLVADQDVAFLFGKLVQDGLWDLGPKPPRGDTNAHYTIHVFQVIDNLQGGRDITFTDPHYWATTGGHQFTIHLDKNKPTPNLLQMSSTTLVEPRYEELVADFRAFGPQSFSRAHRVREETPIWDEVVVTRRPLLIGALALACLGYLGYFGYEAIEAPENQLFGKTVAEGSPKVREVALTFDDGPNPPYTDRILDVLKTENVRATFFVVGRAALAYPNTMRRMESEGHAIGNHTWDHPHLIMQSRSAIRAELNRTQDAIVKTTGHPTHLMRPPFGIRDFRVIAEAHKLGYDVVMWSVPLPNDWEQPGDATIARRVISKVEDGSIIVLHDGNRGRLCSRERHASPHDCDRTQEIAATREIVETLRAQGYRFVTIPRLMADANMRRVASAR